MSTTNLIKSLTSKGLIRPPFNPESVQYLAVMGSEAYGASDDHSDWDVYGWHIPDKSDVFPHASGKIWGFDFPNSQEFLKPWQHHHILDQSAQRGAGREYDLCMYHILRFFSLLTEGNPNMIDSLFVPQRCIIHMTPVAELMREKRHLFLHKGCWPKFKGYAFTQLHKLRTKNPEGNRKEVIAKFGFDVKFASHAVRLLLEIEQIMLQGDLNLEQNKEILKSIRRGEWTIERVERWFEDKEIELDSVRRHSQIPEEPDYDAIKALLLQILEVHFTTLKNCIETNVVAETTIKEIKQILIQNGYL